MKKIFDQRFFRLLSECSQRKVSASEFAEAIEELATHVANFSINEQWKIQCKLPPKTKRFCPLVLK